MKYNDKRANPDGKLLDDVWTDIPRLAGTPMSSERKEVKLSEWRGCHRPTKI
jgi:hypothetical protein